MSSTNNNIDLKEFANKIYNHFGEHEKNVKKLFVKSSIVTLDGFYKRYELELQEHMSVITPTKETPSVADFADIFKNFEDYPSNLQKPKKASPRIRMNSTISKGVSSDCIASATQKNSSASSSMNASKLEDYPSATETYGSFKQFQQKLKQLIGEMKMEDLSAAYAAKLEQLNSFAQQLEQLLPEDLVTQNAFDANEEQALSAVATNLQQLNFVLSHRAAFQCPSTSTNFERLDCVLELLTHCLKSISC